MYVHEGDPLLDPLDPFDQLYMALVESLVALGWALDDSGHGDTLPGAESDFYRVFRKHVGELFEATQRDARKIAAQRIELDLLRTELRALRAQVKTPDQAEA